MSPAVAFLGGILLIWLVANGRAGDIWRAVTGATSTTKPSTPTGTPAPDDHSIPGIDYNPHSPPTTG